VEKVRLGLGDEKTPAETNFFIIILKHWALSFWNT
jgi:hypothetical protein